MKLATALANTLETAGENAKYDAAVKCLLADKMILAWILKSCVDEFRETAVPEIAAVYIEGDPQIAEVPVLPDEAGPGTKISATGVEDVTLTEGTITFDIRFEATVPGRKEKISLIINLEAQNDFYPGYPLVKRGLYYCSRIISSQYGTVFTKSHYEKIKKVYSIWICMNPPKKRRNTITGYSISEKNYIGQVKEPAQNYDLLASVMIGLGTPEDGTYEGILKLLGVLLSSDIKPDQKQEILERDFSIPMTETLQRQVYDMCNLSKGVEEKGFEKAELSAIKNLMQKLKMTAEQAMETLDISADKRAHYSALLDK